MIIFENLTKMYDNKIILLNLNYKFKENIKYCFLGKSGIGKTTLLKILLGIEKVDDGKIIHNDCKKSVVFQNDRLFEDFTVLENLTVINKNIEYCIEILNKLDIFNEEKNICLNLSGGMKRRIAIARALAFKSDEYYFDEPFKGLDYNTKEKVINVIKEYTKNKTCFFITHSIEEAFKIADVVINIDKSPINNFEILKE